MRVEYIVGAGRIDDDLVDTCRASDVEDVAAVGLGSLADEDIARTGYTEPFGGVGIDGECQTCRGENARADGGCADVVEAEFIGQRISCDGQFFNCSSRAEAKTAAGFEPGDLCGAPHYDVSTCSILEDRCILYGRCRVSVGSPVEISAPSLGDELKPDAGARSSVGVQDAGQGQTIRCSGYIEDRSGRTGADAHVPCVIIDIR